MNRFPARLTDARADIFFIFSMSSGVTKAPAASVGPSLPSVPAERKKMFCEPRTYAVKSERKRKSHLLVSSAFSFSSNRYGSFAAGDDQRQVLSGRICPESISFGKQGKTCSCLGCLTGQGRAEDACIITQHLRRKASRIAGKCVVPQDDIHGIFEYRIVFLWASPE